MHVSDKAKNADLCYEVFGYASLLKKTNKKLLPYFIN